jgi:hypothetical protein
MIRTLVLAACAMLALAGTPRAETDVARWNRLMLDAAMATRSNDLVIARMLAVVHRATYDAWAAYDAQAAGIHLDGNMRRPAAERTEANKREAIAHAAFHTLVDLMPTERPRFMAALRAASAVSPDAAAPDGSPAAIGRRAAALELAAAHLDGSNQRGDLRPGAYSDWTRYSAPNPPDRLVAWRLHQPTPGPDGTPRLFGAAHWGRVRTFAADVAAVRPTTAPMLAATEDEARAMAQELLDISANLTDRQKAIAELFTLSPGTPTPPGQWAIFARHVAAQRNHGLDDDARMFMLLGNAMHDTAVAFIETKVHYRAGRPQTVVQHLFRGQTVRAWGGRGRGTQSIQGEAFMPYRPNAASPDQVSGHSAFAGAGAAVLRWYTGADALGFEMTVPAGGFMFDNGPAQPVVIAMPTLGDAERYMALSGVFGQAHFTLVDQMGRQVGHRVAAAVWGRAQAHFAGRN